MVKSHAPNHTTPTTPCCSILILSMFTSIRPLWQQGQASGGLRCGLTAHAMIADLEEVSAHDLPENALPPDEAPEPKRASSVSAVFQLCTAS